MTMGKLASLGKSFHRLWSVRRRYLNSRDWLYSFYHRILLRFPRLPLPERNHLRQVRLTEVREPFHVRLGTTDWYVLEEIFIDGVYQPLIKLQIKDVRHIVDLGANSGFSIRLWQLSYPTACVIGVEPDAENLEMCLRNALTGTTDDQLKLVQACVAGRSRAVSLERSRGAWEFRMQEPDQAGQESIRAITMSQLLAECRVESPIDVLKCDIEGAESEVFADCGAWIHQVRNLIIELHPPYSSEQFLADLSRGGARFELYCRTPCEGGSELLFLQQAELK